MNARQTPTPSAPAQLLPRLWITRFQGQALALPWAWSATEPSVNLTELLTRSGQEGDKASLSDLASCRVGVVGEHSAARLAFEHSSRTLRCQHNARLLAPGQLAWLEPGDVLEVGLCRCEIRDIEDANTSAGAPGATAPEPLPEVDLTALTALRPPSLDSPPGGLMDLLGPELQSQPSEGLGSPASGMPRPIPAESDALGEANTELQTDADADEPLSQLHDKYLRRLNSPFTDPGEGTWTDLARDGQQANADPFDTLMVEAGDGRSLHAMLGLGERIDGVLAQLEQLGEANILSPEPAHKLLHLFAPAAWREAQAHQRLPQLSRQEHHGITLDSALNPDALEPHSTSSHRDKP